MAGPFVVESGVPGTQVWSVDFSGNVVQSGTITPSAFGPANLSGITTQIAGAGVNSSLSANYLAALGFGVSAASGTQLTDLTRDYMVYITTTAGGANNTVTIGNNTTATTATIYACATTGTGILWSFRLPAAWYVRCQGAVAIGNQFAISC